MFLKVTQPSSRYVTVHACVILYSPPWSVPTAVFHALRSSLACYVFCLPRVPWVDHFNIIPWPRLLIWCPRRTFSIAPALSQLTSENENEYCASVRKNYTFKFSELIYMTKENMILNIVPCHCCTIYIRGVNLRLAGQMRPRWPLMWPL
jgi:hypothetical protein